MIKRKEREIPREEERWYRYSDMEYLYGLGKNTCRKLAKEAGAVRHVGRAVIIDRKKVEAYLDSQEEM